jgi:imidazolonepropionase-like amidohydrolase
MTIPKLSETLLRVDNGDGLPTYTDATSNERGSRLSWRTRPRKSRLVRLLIVITFIYSLFSVYTITRVAREPQSTLSAERLTTDYATCAILRRRPVENNETRTKNKRWIKTTKPVLIRNASVWTGEPAVGTSKEDARAGKGWSWISSDVLVDRGVIVQVAHGISIQSFPPNAEIYEANGRLLTSGIVDMHSHAGLGSFGNLQEDSNELSADITPFVRSIDGVDPLQPELEFIKSGGVTTSLFLPGSGNNMGGEAYVLKFAVGPKGGREEISQQDLFADPDRNWRYMKMACGENPKRVYGKYGEQGPFSRLGEAWAFRHALEQATKYVQEQDDWCAAADKIGAQSMKSYLKQELEWESLGAVLRGQVRVNTHCYTIADLEAMVRHTNEFKFRVYAFHHAHQTFLVPEVLKRTWGGTPAAALFADNSESTLLYRGRHNTDIEAVYYKVEAYTASERAGSILYNNSITPVYVSDNPVLNSQHVVFEAAKAYGYGLPYHVALAGVTSKPAELLGLGDRIGKIKEGFDADMVVWDSDPLSVGATPVQVWIDGAKQFKDPIELKKPNAKPIVPNLDLAEEPKMVETGDFVVFTGINYTYLSRWGGPDSHGSPPQKLVAVVKNGKVACVGECFVEQDDARSHGAQVISLEDGYLTPPFTAFGSSLGLAEIDSESDTQDGPTPDDGITRAADGLLFGGKQLARAFEHGVARAISAPSSGGINAKGVSVGFRTDAKHSLDKDAIWKEEVGLHYVLTLSAKGDKTPSISGAINLLRGKLLDAVNDNSSAEISAPTKTQYEEKAYLKKVVSGAMPLILSAHSADTISSIIRLKSTIESAIAKKTSSSPSTKLRLVIIGGAESHLIASELANANISVVLAPLLPHSQTWDQRRSLTGAPLTNGTTINYLIDAGVLTAISVEETWETRDLGLLAGIAFANSEGRLDFKGALDLVGGNIYKALGIAAVTKENNGQDWVIWEGSPLEIGGRIRGMGGNGKATLWK